MDRIFDDEKLEGMLESYFGRKTEKSFEVDFDKGKRSVAEIKKSLIFSAAVCVCAVMISAVGVFSVVRSSRNNTPVTSSGNEQSLLPDSSHIVSENKEKRLFLSAYTEKGISETNSAVFENPDRNSEVSVYNYYNYGTEDYGGVYFDYNWIFYFDDEDKTLVTEDNFENYDELWSYMINKDENSDTEGGSFEWNGCSIIAEKLLSLESYSLVIDIRGEDILTYDLECENGSILLFGMTASDYYKQLQKDIPYNNDYEDICWVPSNKIDDEIPKIDDDINYYSVEKRSDTMMGKLQSAEDYTYYFGDTITVTAHFEDGTTETSAMVITLDENGNYLIEYK